MAEKKEQKIVVLTENATTDHNLILHGIKLAAIFGKELCFASLLANSGNPEPLEESNSGYMKVIHDRIPVLRMSSVILAGNPENYMDELADDYEAILVVTRISRYKDLSKILRESPIPMLFVDENRAEIGDYKQIVLPIDVRKESKDAILWSSYFARFNQSTVRVVSAADKAKENAQGVAGNLLSLKNLFGKFNLRADYIKGEKGSLQIQFEALDVARHSNSDLLIILGSSYVSVFDMILGLPEKKILSRASGFPVLVINPRKDMYILCD
jgi:hypothetical protein